MLLQRAFAWELLLTILTRSGCWSLWFLLWILNLGIQEPLLWGALGNGNTKLLYICGIWLLQMIQPELVGLSCCLYFQMINHSFDRVSATTRSQFPWYHFLYCNWQLLSWAVPISDTFCIIYENGVKNQSSQKPPWLFLNMSRHPRLWVVRGPRHRERMLGVCVVRVGIVFINTEIRYHRSQPETRLQPQRAN